MFQQQLCVLPSFSKIVQVTLPLTLISVIPLMSLPRKLRASPSNVLKYDPLTYFAGEINGEIFSHLSAQDLDECMLVNKDWRQRAPHLSPQPWRTLHLMCDVAKTISYQLPPFYDSIEAINFMDYDHRIIDVLKVNVTWNCQNIKKLCKFETTFSLKQQCT